MNHTKEQFLDLLSKLPAESSFWIREDYFAIKKMQQSGLISPMFANSELERLFEEAKELVEKVNDGN